MIALMRITSWKPFVSLQKCLKMYFKNENSSHPSTLLSYDRPIIWQYAFMVFFLLKGNHVGLC